MRNPHSSSTATSRSPSRRQVCLLLSGSLLPPAVFAQPKAGSPAKGPLELAGVKASVWGEYTVEPMMFPGEAWKFVVVVVPKDVRQGTLIRMAQDFYRRFPNTRARFFSDTAHIRQYADRDRYMNDKTGKVKEVPFPKTEWVQDHLLGNINNRSKQHGRAWMLEDRYGNRIAPLP